MWLHGLSDALIAIAYFVIAFALWYFVQKRQDVPFRLLFGLFVAFIAACGVTHILAVWTLWVPQYWLSGTAKAITAFVSVYTAITIVPLIPSALDLPSPSQLAALNGSLEKEVEEHKAAKAEIQRLNTDLEARVAARTGDLAAAKEANERLLQQEQAYRSKLETTLSNLQDTAARLNIAMSAAQMGSWEWELADDTQIWSPRTQTILGYEGEDIVQPSAQLWKARVLPDDRPQVEAALAQAKQQQTIFAEEYRVRHPDNSLHWVLAQGRFLFDAAGQPYRMLGVLQETTVNKQSELALQASEVRFRAVFEQSAVGMARLTPAGQWLQVNQRLCELLGYKPEEMLGRHFQDFTDPGDFAQDEHYYRQLINGEVESCRFEKRYLHRNGKPVWVMATVSTERYGNEDIISFIAVIEDISDIKAARSELQQRAEELEGVNGLLAVSNAMLENRNTELDQFAYVASHDLKAPLRAIANLSEWIEEDLSGQIPDENQHQLSLLRNRVHRMESLINGLLTFSRVGRQERRIETVDVRPMLDEIIDLLAPPAAFTIDLPETMPTLQTNRTALGQVFSNLISNAIKHHDREQGKIRITSTPHDDFIEFTVSDDGPGIDPIYHQKIFTIFQTLKSRDEQESTGIGLALVKKIVESEGGTINIDSALGSGTTFRFTWPIG